LRIENFKFEIAETSKKRLEIERERGGFVETPRVKTAWMPHLAVVSKSVTAAAR
jgi:hypothetical protein